MTELSLLLFIIYYYLLLFIIIYYYYIPYSLIVRYMYTKLFNLMKLAHHKMSLSKKISLT